MGSVQVVQGDTDDIAYGTGTGACRSIIVGGSPLSADCDGVIEAGMERPPACWRQQSKM